MKEQRARVVLLESWYPPDTAAAVARRAGATLVVLPQSPGAVRGTDDYLAHMDYLVTTLTRALSGAD
jgi:ABC-type Zn uptake system ZnuABC Zn-binding protein ZnuA